MCLISARSIVQIYLNLIFIYKMYLLLVFLSIIGSCLTGLFGKHLGSKGSAILTTSCLFISFFLSIILFYEVILTGCPVYVKITT